MSIYKNIFKDKELEENPTIRNFLIVQQEGKRKVKRDIEHYSLDMIISVGYRVNSSQATQFRIWATKILQEYIIKGINANWLTIIKNKIIESVKEIYGFCSWRY